MKIAIFLPNWIGDAIMATPALRVVREHFANAHVIGVLKPYVAGVLEGAPWLDSHLFLDARGSWQQRWPRVALALRRERVDLALLLPNSFRSALAAWLGGCKQRIGYVRYGRGPLLTEGLEPLRDRHGRLQPYPAIDAFNRLAQAAGCPWPSYRMEVFTTPHDDAVADVVWDRAGLNRHAEILCLNPGAAFGAAKYWPVEYFSTLARDLAERRGCGVLVLCGPQEQEMARQIAVSAQHPAVHALSNLCDANQPSPAVLQHDGEQTDCNRVCSVSPSPSGRGVGVMEKPVSSLTPGPSPRGRGETSETGSPPRREETSEKGSNRSISVSLSLGLTKACIRRCDLLITTDSGPRHVGTAFNRPVITLFGPTHIAWTETYHPQAVHLQKQVPCGPCQLRTCPLDHRCMRELMPAEVSATAMRLLDHPARLAG